MSSPFFVFSPFSYDSTSIEVMGEDKENKELENFSLSVIRPREDTTRLIADINRDVMSGILFINGVNALELRKRDKLTTVQLELHNLSNEQIDSLPLDKIQELMKRHKKEITVSEEEQNTIDKIVKEISVLSENEARKALKSYKESLDESIPFDTNPKNSEQSFKEYIEFLSKHLLRSINNSEERAFLAKTIAHSSHQSGLTKAASAQYKTNADTEFRGRIHEGDQIREATFDPAKSVCYMECKNGVVSFKEDARFQRIVQFKKYQKVVNNYVVTESEFHEKEGKDYWARVQSTIFIKAKKTMRGPNVTFENIDLSGNRILIDLKKDNEQVNKLCNRVFVDPRTAWRKILDSLIKRMTRSKIKSLDPPEPAQEPAHEPSRSRRAP